MIITEINFKVRGKKKSWKVKHNLYEYGLSIDAAFINWSARAKPDELEPEFFEEYVVDKDPINLRCKVIKQK